MLFTEAVTDFLEEKEYQGVSPATITYYERRINTFQEHSNAQELRDFTARAGRKWLMSYEDVSRNTLANYDRALRVFSNWLSKRGYVDDSPMDSLSQPKEVPTKVQTFTAKEVARILDVAQDRTNPLRDTALITTLVDTGIRIGEATSLELTDIDWREGVLDLRGKTGERSAPFGRKSKAALKRYIDHERVARSHTVRHVFLTMEGDPFTFQIATQHLCRLARDAGL